MLRNKIATLLLFTFVCMTSAYADISVIVQGNRIISTESIIAYSQIDVKKMPDDYTISKILNNIYETGLFKNVEIFIQDNTVTLQVEENNRINEIIFKGNSDIPSKNLKQVIGNFTIASNSNLDIILKKTRAVYAQSGFYNAKIEQKIESISENKVNVVMYINEGERLKVKSINFFGNEAFDGYELKKQITTREKNKILPFFDDSQYNKAVLDNDLKRIKSFYMNNGYLDFEVLSSSVILNEDDQFVINIVVNEGEKYYFANNKITSEIDSIDTSELEQWIFSKSSEIYKQYLITKTENFLRFHVKKMGYKFIDVKSSTKRKGKKVNVSYKIVITNPKYIDRVNIAGNVRTQDEVIRGKISLIEGDPLDNSNVRNSKIALQNTGFFNRVSINTKPSKYKDRINVEIRLEEKSTGKINIGGGYSSRQGFLGNFAINEQNFLGTGQSLGLSLQRSSLGYSMSVSTSKNNFMDSEFAVGASVSSSKIENNTNSGYSFSKTTFSLSASVPLTNHILYSFGYSYGTTELADVSNTVSNFIKKQVGKDRKSAINHAVIFSTIDNNLLPSKGFKMKLAHEYAGIGGNVNYIQQTFDASYYLPIYKNDHVLRIRGKFARLGVLDNQYLKITNRFFSSGDEVRGFSDNGIGPRDLSTTSRSALGGDTMYLLSAEARLKLGRLSEKAKVSGLAFLDIANLTGVYDKESKIVSANMFRISFGVGILWFSPIGPMRFYYSRPIRKHFADKTQAFRLSIGTNF